MQKHFPLKRGPSQGGFLAILFCVQLANGWLTMENSYAQSVAAPDSRDSISQFGVTWTFEKKSPVGRFINGDYYVVGPVTITALDPKPLYGEEIPESELDEIDRGTPRARNLRNGSMLNPPGNRAEVALDSGIRNYFRPELDTKLPIAMKPGDILVSSVSRKIKEPASFPFYNYPGPRGDNDNCPLKTVAILTCVEKPLPPDAFRPSYGDRKQTIYLARNLHRDLLPKLPVPKAKDFPDPAKFADVFQRPWFNPCFFGFDQPMENMPHYGQAVGHAVSDAGVLLCLDLKPEDKERLLINFVQVGIDYWGLVKSGHPGWQGWGGHGSGRKFPIVVVGSLLGDEEMSSPGKSFPKCNFGEDNQTRYGDCWGGAKVVFAGHSGIQSDSGKAERPAWGPYEHLHPAQWDEENWRSESYRRANTGCSWVGEALALRILKLEKNWNHDPFLDYMDRWMTEDDKAMRLEMALCAPEGSKRLTEDSADWAHQGYAGDNEGWVQEAWKLYRTAEGMPATDGWKQTKEGPHIPSEYLIPKEKQPLK